MARRAISHLSEPRISACFRVWFSLSKTSCCSLHLGQRDSFTTKRYQKPSFEIRVSGHGNFYQWNPVNQFNPINPRSTFLLNPQKALVFWVRSMTCWRLFFWAQKFTNRRCCLSERSPNLPPRNSSRNPLKGQSHGGFLNHRATPKSIDGTFHEINHPQ